MTDATTVAASVEVGVDPETAFRVFTEELGCWWLQGPINFFDSARALSMRMEPGVGGRILEVYDHESGDGLELARLTAWDPGARLAWTSSIDDVETEVRFERHGDGTLVSVQASLPAGGTDRGGTAWVRVVPTWLARWCARRDDAPHDPVAPAWLAGAVHYRDPLAGARWLRDVAGLAPVSRIPESLDPSREGPWIEFRVGTATVVVMHVRPAGEAAPSGPTHTPWVFVADLDDHHARLVANGGAVVEAPWRHGVYAYGVEDPEGNRWTFAQASPRMLAAAPRG